MVDEVEIFVCVACEPRREGAVGARSGTWLAQSVHDRLAKLGATGITVRKVECLAVCKRPSTIALTAPGKWTYVIGDLDPGTHVADIVATAMAFQRSDAGIVPWADRPAPFRRGVIARVPPLGFEQPAAETA